MLDIARTNRYNKFGSFELFAKGASVMYSHFQNNKLNNDDFNVVQFGVRDCRPNFCVYHKRCQNYLLHYVYSGKGMVHVNGKDHDLKENQAFIIYPGQETWYSSDKNDPFTYRWVEFFGNKAYDFLQTAGLTMENPVYTASEPYDSGRILKEMTDIGAVSSFQITGLFWMLANSLIKEKEHKFDNTENLFRSALRYIHENVDKPTTVEDVSKNTGVTRGYLAKIFNKCINQPPKQYIVRYHMNEARSLLAGTDMTVAEVAAAVGYNSPADFTKAFSKLMKCSPSAYRKQQNNK